MRRRLARLAARTIRTRTLHARPSGPIVTFTFDDIPASAAVRGAALIEEIGARATFFVAGGLIEADGTGRFASAQQCRDLHARGHEIGCHTFSHRAVSELGPRALSADIARNRSWLKTLDSGLAPESFAYPFNTTSLPSKWLLERRFACCRGGVPGINAGRIDLGFLRAVELADGFIDRDAIRAWIASTVAQKGWLVFFSHGVAEEPEPWGCHPGLLAFALSEARAQAAAILTMRDALRRIGSDAWARALFDEVDAGSSSKNAATQELGAVPDCEAIGHGSKPTGEQA